MELDFGYPSAGQGYGATLQGAYPMRVDYGSQAAAADVVVERLGRRPFGLVAEFCSASGVVSITRP